MAAPSPLIDRRDFEAILKEARALAPFYTPEWNANRETGAGAVLLKVFAGLFEGLVRRLNDVPRRDFIAFLDRLGVKLLPAQPARAPLTFFLSTGAKEAVTIPARSQAAATTAKGETVVFETEQTILATPAQLKAVVSVVSARDQLFDHQSSLQSGALTQLFDGQDLQEHALYLGHDDLFNLKGAATIELTFTLASGAPALFERLEWQYYGEREIIKGDKQTEWWRFDPADAALPNAKLLSGKIVLTKGNRDELKQFEVNGLKRRWIRGLVKGPLAPSHALAKLRIKDIKVGPQPSGLTPDAAISNDVSSLLPPADATPLLPFGPRPRQGDAFYLASQEAFSKKGASIKLGLFVVVKPVAMTALDVERVHGLGKQFVLRLGQREIRTIPELLKLTPEALAEIIHNRAKGIPAAAYHVRAQNILEAAAKRYYDKVVSQGGTLTSPTGGLEDLSLSWEYWNGKAWVLIKGLKDESKQFLLSGARTISFDCPGDLAPTKVAGQENYWIRVRIAFGDYGAEEIKLEDANSTDPAKPPHIVVNKDNIFPPKLTALTLDYSLSQPLTAIVTRNNLQYRAETTTPAKTPTSFAPFVALDDRAQTLYLGFDSAPLKGPISIFFSLSEQAYAEDKRPRLEWEYFRQRAGAESGEWAGLLVEDGTRSLTESGVIEFIGPPDFGRARLFGQALYWLRAVEVENRFGLDDTNKSLLPAILSSHLRLVDLAALRWLRDRLRLPIQLTGTPMTRRLFDGRLESTAAPVEVAPVETAPPPSEQLSPCDENLETFQPPFSTASRSALAPPPEVKGIYPNTAWAIQAETITDEMLGSSAGLGHQAFTLAKFPALTESVWVNELGSLTESERQALGANQDLTVDEQKDGAGNVTAFWIRWRAVEDLTAAAAADRVYEIDRTFGRVQFGSGVHGRVPPIGRDNIKATYQSGGGARGNVAAQEIKALRTTIPSVDRVVNPEPAGGGADTEAIERALERGPQRLRQRQRAITADGFEALAREASRAIARVKCLPNFNDQGVTETGWVTVIIVPQSQAARPAPSPQLRARVEQSLRAASANVASFPRRVKVNGPAYVEVSVTAEVFPVRMDFAPQVEAAAVGELQRFLHPLTGGDEGRGWDFGRLPCLSDFYALLEALQEVDHVAQVTMLLRAISPSGAALGGTRLVTEDRPIAVEMPEYALIFSGDHRMTVKALG